LCILKQIVLKLANEFNLVDMSSTQTQLILAQGLSMKFKETLKDFEPFNSRLMGFEDRVIEGN
jgi:hypothetical protein